MVAIAAQMVFRPAEPPSLGLWRRPDAFLRCPPAPGGLDGPRNGAAHGLRRQLSDAAGRRPTSPARCATPKPSNLGLLAMFGLAHREAGRLPGVALFVPAIRLAEEALRCRRACMACWPSGGASPIRRPRPCSSMPRGPWPVGYHAAATRPCPQPAPRCRRGPAGSAPGRTRRARAGRGAVVCLPTKLTGAACSAIPISPAVSRSGGKPCAGPIRATGCGFPPPSLGGSTVLATLGIWRQLPGAPAGSVFIHPFCRGRSAGGADRAACVGDPMAAPVPVEAMLDERYRPAGPRPSGPGGSPRRAAGLCGEGVRQRMRGPPAIYRSSMALATLWRYVVHRGCLRQTGAWRGLLPQQSADGFLGDGAPNDRTGQAATQLDGADAGLRSPWPLRGAWLTGAARSQLLPRP